MKTLKFLLQINLACLTTRSCLDDIHIDFYDEDGGYLYCIQMYAASETEVFVGSGTCNPEEDKTEYLFFPFIQDIDASNTQFGTILIDHPDNDDSIVEISINFNDLDLHTEANTDDVLIRFSSGRYNSVSITVDDYFSGSLCGLCGFFNFEIDDDLAVIEEQDDGEQSGSRRILLQDNNTSEVLVPLDSDGVSTWPISDDAWIITSLFGDSWSVNPFAYINVTYDNTSLLTSQPSEQCINAATTLCNQVWDEQAACQACELIVSGVSFNDWEQACIFDSCAEAIDAGFNLEDLIKEVAEEFGFFDGAVSSCDGQCKTYKQCPSECYNDGTSCDCNDDENCHICQPQGHCSQCNDGYFRKTDRNHICYPCQFYAGLGCRFCQDFIGCGQCENGYTRIYDASCELYYCA